LILKSIFLWGFYGIPGSNSQHLGVSSFGFGGTNARADLWGHCQVGPRQLCARLVVVPCPRCGQGSLGSFLMFVCLFYGMGVFFKDPGFAQDCRSSFVLQVFFLNMNLY
jgi:hypothetical protein